MHKPALGVIPVLPVLGITAVVFPKGYHELRLVQAQEVLAGLHGHLGSGQAGEISTALSALLSLTHSRACQLLQHADFLGSLLDCLHNFSQAQLHQVGLYGSDLALT